IIVILTHEHFDHINGLNWLRERFICEVFANEVCSENVCFESKNLSNNAEVIALFNANIRERNVTVIPFVCHVDHTFQNQMKLKWNRHELVLLTTPGHTEGSICIILDNQYLFSGDTLLGIPTITRLPGGSRKKFLQITLPLLREVCGNEMKVYPGHGSFGLFGKMIEQYDSKG
ncbi:MAG: MBL fold metallo-hydrolase, partial [Lachnospiraceae bacterium]|nr:MBL fold metallo-hydrolase [Lachnospiraceae bacterium]